MKTLIPFGFFTVMACGVMAGCASSSCNEWGAIEYADNTTCNIGYKGRHSRVPKIFDGKCVAPGVRQVAVCTDRS